MTREIDTWLSDSIGPVTKVWLTTEADDRSSLHYVIVSTDVMSDHDVPIMLLDNKLRSIEDQSQTDRITILR